ncbi:hypothetical protein VYU27_010615, partial [Nannochloropsis oceanica]
MEAGLIDEAVATLQSTPSSSSSSSSSSSNSSSPPSLPPSPPPSADPLLKKELASACLALAYNCLADGFHARAAEALQKGIAALGCGLEGGREGGREGEGRWACWWKLKGDLLTLAALLPEESGVDEGMAWLALGRKQRMKAGEGSFPPPPAAAAAGDESTRAAKACFIAALKEHDPCLADAWNGLGVCEAREGRVLVAQHCFVRALQLESHPGAWANLGMLYASVGREDLAREALRGLQLVQ